MGSGGDDNDNEDEDEEGHLRLMQHAMQRRTMRNKKDKNNMMMSHAAGLLTYCGYLVSGMR